MNKQNVFLDSQDYAVFLSYLKSYLEPKDVKKLQTILDSTDSNYREKAQAEKLLRLNNFYGQIDLVAYVLMSNHFHLLVWQKDSDSIDRFLNSLATRYAVYFNRKYHRVGRLYQGVYKAVSVESEAQLLHLSRYIHLNPFVKLNLPVARWTEISAPSSLPEFLGARNTAWLKPDAILSYFRKESKNNTYLNFVSEYQDNELIAPVALDLDEG